MLLGIRRPFYKSCECAKAMLSNVARHCFRYAGGLAETPKRPTHRNT